MLSVNALDFMNYKNALKGNYRKGVHAFRCILENPTQAADFAANLGGVCVVFGVPIGQDDRNSQQLLALLQASSVIDQAALTWLSQWYADYADDWDTMAGDTARASAIASDALIWRAVGSSPVGAGKIIAAIAGLSCQDYADIAAVAASSTAMAAVAASQTAMAAVIASSTALNAVVSSSTAMAAVTASPVAVAAIWQNTVAIQVLQGNSTAWATFTGASSQVMGKAVAILAGLNPDDYADMTAVAASSTAMAAVIASSTALNAVVSSSTAMAAVAASQTAMAAVAASQTAMTAVAASSTAMAAVAASQTAMAAVAASKTALSACRASSTAMAKLAASSTALSALAASSLVTKYNPTSGNAWTTGTVNGSGIFIKVISYQANNNTVTIDSGSAQSISNSTNYAKAFQSKLAVYYVPYSVSGYGIYYIPC